MAFGKAALCTALTTAALVGCPHALGQSGVLDPGDTPATSAGPIEPGELISGVIDVSGDVDMFSIELASAPAMLDLAVAHTDSKCEIWATLLDSQGTELQTIFVPREGALSLNSLALLAGTYYVAISTGKYVDCSGANYTVRLTLVDLPEEGLTSGDPDEMRLTARRWGSAISCSQAEEKVARLGVRRRNLIRRVRLSQGVTKRRLERRLAEVSRLYYSAKAAATRECRGLRSGPQ